MLASQPINFLHKVYYDWLLLSSRFINTFELHLWACWINFSPYLRWLCSICLIHCNTWYNLGKWSLSIGRFISFFKGDPTFSNGNIRICACIIPSFGFSNFLYLFFLDKSCAFNPDNNFIVHAMQQILYLQPFFSVMKKLQSWTPYDIFINLVALMSKYKTLISTYRVPLEESI